MTSVHEDAGLNGRLYTDCLRKEGGEVRQGFPGSARRVVTIEENDWCLKQYHQQNVMLTERRRALATVTIVSDVCMANFS